MTELFDISIRSKDSVKKKTPYSKKTKTQYYAKRVPTDMNEGIITKSGKVSHGAMLYPVHDDSLSLNRHRNIYYIKGKGTILIISNEIRDSPLQRNHYTPIIKGSEVKGYIIEIKDVKVFKIEYVKYPFDDKFLEF